MIERIQFPLFVVVLAGFIALCVYAYPAEACADCDPVALSNLIGSLIEPMTDADKMIYLFDSEGNEV